MDSTSSVSKGVFVFNNLKSETNAKRKSKFKEEESLENLFASQLWYQSYKDLWKNLERKIKKLNTEMFSKISTDLLVYVKNCYNNPVTEIPTATILMGINMPDHADRFSTLYESVKYEITPHVALLHSDDCTSIKLMIENMVSQFINDFHVDNDQSDTDDVIIKKSLCTFNFLISSYNKKYKNSTKFTKRHKVEQQKNLVVILPEFESFQEVILQDFILILSSYLNDLPFILIFGVATSVTTIHKILPFQVTSKLNIEVFSSQSSTEYLNNILNNILLSENCPFHLGGKTFSLFTDIFLFYDFSVKGFIQNFKFSMLEHYSYGNAMSLCTTKSENVDIILSKFDHADFENVRRLMSFRHFVESKDYKERIKLIEDDKYFKQELKKCIFEFHEYIFCFHMLLKCLHILVSDLPGSPLGKQFRELYAISVTKKVTDTEEFKQCFQYLNLTSQDEFRSKITKICALIKQSLNLNKENKLLESILEDFNNLLIENCGEMQIENSVNKNKVLKENHIANRSNFKEELLKMYKTGDKSPKKNKLHTLKNIFDTNMNLPNTKPFYEIFFFNNTTAVKNHVVGSHRAAIHMALNNPNCYLQCDCCILPTDLNILPSLPDVSIVYKLHLECGKFINMYDWLQAFVMIVNPDENYEEDERNVDPKLQARFAKAVAELEFLGFIKSSKRKTDHVQRLTWGGC